MVPSGHHGSVEGDGHLSRIKKAVLVTWEMCCPNE